MDLNTLPAPPSVNIDDAAAELMTIEVTQAHWSGFAARVILADTYL